MRNIGKWTALFILILCCDCSKSDTPQADSEVCIGIAWRADTSSEFYTNVLRAFEAAGIKTVMLPQVKVDEWKYDGEILAPEYYDEHQILRQDYANMVKSGTESNADEILDGVDAVVFTGGEDIAPTLYRNPVAWHGIMEELDYNATRDVSDYLLMSQVLEEDIPMMGMCRGMQMIGVVSGATVIQDIPVYFADKGKIYNFEHRNVAPAGGYRDYAPHDVDVKDRNSLIYAITQTDVIRGVPSWHHQAVDNVDGTPLSITATTTTDGIEIIEVLERKDKSFVIGLQYHPEAAIVKWLDNYPNASSFMAYNNAIAYFKALAAAAKKKAGR